MDEAAREPRCRASEWRRVRSSRSRWVSSIPVMSCLEALTKARAFLPKNVQFPINMENSLRVEPFLDLLQQRVLPRRRLREEVGHWGVGV